jgi:lysozyme
VTVRDQLKADEGFREFPYLDCCGKPWKQCVCEKKGKLTVGWGRNLEDVPLSHDEAEVMLSNDMTRSTNAVVGRLPWTVRELSPVRLGVLVQMAFQMGIGGLLSFHKFLTAAQAGDWAEAKYQMLDSKWAEEDSPSRARRLADQFLTGVDV